MSATFIGLLGIVFLFALILLQMPVGFAMAIVGVIGFGIVNSSFTSALNIAVVDIINIFSSYSLTVIPLFILMGQIAYYSGMSGRLFKAAHKVLGYFSGGLIIALVGTCAAFSAICGSSNATAATMASLAFPEMQRYGCKTDFVAGVVAAGGSLGIIIPPSVVLIIYGILTEQSIGKLFIASIIPGLLMTGLFILTVIICCKLDTSLCPKTAAPPTLRDILSSIGLLGEVALIFGIIMGGLFFGIFTPTEAAAVGALTVIIISKIRRSLTMSDFKKAVIDTVRLSCMILVIVAGATIFGRFMTVTRVAFDLANWLAGFGGPSWLGMSMIIIILLVGGCFIDSLALVMLTTPVFFGIVVQFGYDPLWFGVIMAIITQLGVITPPVGLSVFIVSSISGVPSENIFKKVIPFLIALIMGIIILMRFPGITLILL